MIDVTSRRVSCGTFTMYFSSAIVWSAHVNTFRVVARRPFGRSMLISSTVRVATDGSRGTQVTNTMSPTATFETSDPTAITSPVASCPSTWSLGRGLCI